MTCPLQDAGTIELYFYDELPAPERRAVTGHLPACPACRQALEELAAVRAALAAQPDVAAPPDGWPAFMARLDRAVAAPDAGPRAPLPDAWPWTASPAGSGYLAAAAAIALVTLSVLFAPGRRPAGDAAPGRQASAQQQLAPAPDAMPADAVSADAVPAPDPALVSLSGQHFERSKLVVLGLATKEPEGSAGADWAYERELAGTLLGDTRLYRQAAEARGMNGLADVMRDLELVLLQTSMAQEPDAGSLEQLQRLIRRRDLLTKMDVVHARADGRAARGSQ